MYAESTQRTRLGGETSAYEVLNLDTRQGTKGRAARARGHRLALKNVILNVSILIAIIIILAIIYYYFYQNKIDIIKRNGVRVVGTIIYNQGGNSSDSLGGNINTPTIKFHTKDGKEVVGKPVIGFVSQHEVVVPSNINLIYDSKNPRRFCIDAG